MSGSAQSCSHDRGRFPTSRLADPGNPAPHLVFADWLEERGDPFGEFIRLEVPELAGMEEDNPRKGKLRRRVNLLLLEHRLAWSARVPILLEEWRSTLPARVQRNVPATQGRDSMSNLRILDSDCLFLAGDHLVRGRRSCFGF